MDTVFITTASAAIGTFLWWQERDDETEHIGSLGLSSGFWSGVIIILTAFLIQLHHVEPWRFALSLTLFIYVLTAPHNLLLSPPWTQILGKPRDMIQRALYWVFRKRIGETLGLPAYVAFSVIRYALPVAGIGLTLNNFLLICVAPLVSIFYYPWIHSEQSKYVRGAIAGGLITGALVCNQSIV